MASKEYSYGLKIPKERIAVLIGKKGEVKKRIEEETNTKIRIDSEEGEVFVSGKDALGLFTVREIVEAVGRGFNPEISLRLLDDDVALDIIKLTEYVGKSKKALARQKGRIIGRDGITRQIIHEMTGVDMSVYGKTVSIIGDLENLLIAKEAVEMILNGARHKSVYGFLEKKKQDMKLKHFNETINLK